MIIVSGLGVGCVVAIDIQCSVIDCWFIIVAISVGTICVSAFIICAFAVSIVSVIAEVPFIIKRCNGISWRDIEIKLHANLFVVVDESVVFTGAVAAVVEIMVGAFSLIGFMVVASIVFAFVCFTLVILSVVFAGV